MGKSYVITGLGRWYGLAFREVWSLNSLWGFCVFVWCAAFYRGCCIFIQYNLLKGCYEWILIQPWTQVLDYSLPGLTWHTRLRIRIPYLSISGIVIHGRCDISIAFTFLLFFTFLLLFMIVCLVDLCFWFLLSCLSNINLSSHANLFTFFLIDH